MKNFKKLQKLLTSKDGRPVQVRLVKAEIDGKEARTVGLGERDAVTKVSDTQISLASLRRITAPASDDNLEVNEEGSQFKVTRDVGDGKNEVLHYEILPEQEDSAKKLQDSNPGIITKADQSYQPYMEAHPTPELVQGEDSARTPPPDYVVEGEPQMEVAPGASSGKPPAGTEPTTPDTKVADSHKGPMRGNKNNK